MSAENTMRYRANYGNLFVAVQSAVRDCNYKVDKVDMQNGLIVFQSGSSLWTWKGQTMTATIMNHHDGFCDVSIGVVSKGNQITDWGEGGRLVKKVFDLIPKYL